MVIKSRGQFLGRSLRDLRAQCDSVTVIWVMLRQGIQITEKNVRDMLWVMIWLLQCEVFDNN